MTIDLEHAVRPRRPRRGWLRAALVVVGVLAVFVVLAKLPGNAGEPVFGALLAAFVALLLWRRPRWSAFTRITGVTATLLIGAGLVLLSIRAVDIAGIAMFCLAAVVGMPFLTDVVFCSHLYTGRNPRVRRDGTHAERVIGAVAGVCLALAVLGAASTSERGSDGYYLRYGVPVAADTGAGCQRLVNGHVGGSRSGPATYFISCRNASWQVNGVTVHGLLTSTTTTAAGFATQQVPAYAIGDVARAAVGLRAGGPIVALGKLPQLWLVVPWAVAFLGWIVMVVRGRLRTPRLIRPAVAGLSPQSRLARQRQARGVAARGGQPPHDTHSADG